MEKIFIIVVCGPTASGKTRLAVDLALEFGGEVVSADSIQIYKKLDIASAKPTPEEMRGVPHHLIDFLEPAKSFSVADYLPMARECIADIAARGKVPVVCGGTGLYISSLVDNIVFDDTGSDPAYRRELYERAEAEGGAPLLEELRAVDPETAERLHENNLKRIIRALEVYKLSGKTMSELMRESRRYPSPYAACMLMPDFARDVLYERINARVDIMLGQGLLEEAREFFTHTDYATAAQAIGYKELKAYFDGKAELSECVEALKQSTRRYAKRQLTWFGRDKRIERISADRGTEYEEILKKAKNLIKKYSFF